MIFDNVIVMSPIAYRLRQRDQFSVACVTKGLVTGRLGIGGSLRGGLSFARLRHGPHTPDPGNDSHLFGMTGNSPEIAAWYSRPKGLTTVATDYATSD